MKVCSLASGSSGNALFVGQGDTRFLIDCGIIPGQVERGLREIGERVQDLQGVIISHEHTDHIRGARALARKLHLPLYMNLATCQAVPGLLGNEEVVLFGDQPFAIGLLNIEPFPVPHDAAGSVGFSITTDSHKMFIATDLGWVGPDVMARMKGSHLVVLEANYDRDMLENGPYPTELKRRILGQTGHLSNDDAAGALIQAADGSPQKVLLAHLSRQNNDPILARETVQGRMEGAGFGEVEIMVAPRYEVSEPFEF